MFVPHLLKIYFGLGWPSSVLEIVSVTKIKTLYNGNCPDVLCLSKDKINFSWYFLLKNWPQPLHKNVVSSKFFLNRRINDFWGGKVTTFLVVLLGVCPPPPILMLKLLTKICMLLNTVLTKIIILDIPTFVRSH